MFDKTLFFNFIYNSMISVIDYSPSDVYNYVKSNGLIKADQLSSFYAVADDLRSTSSRISFLHGSPYYGDNRDAYSLIDALTTWVDRGYAEVRVSRLGCWSMTRIMIGMLRSINIPGNVTSSYYVIGHSDAEWPSLDIVMPHGDDLYDAWLIATPTAEMFPSYSWYEDPANTAVCGDDKVCLSFRHHALSFMAYPSSWLPEAYCRPQYYGKQSCEEYISSDFAAYLTAEELQTAVGLCQRCSQFWK